jgi:hypothetical protein
MMNPCEGHRCDGCKVCRAGTCCAGRRGSREVEQRVKVPALAGSKR